MPSNHDFNRATSTKLLKLILALYRKELVDIPDAGHTDDILLLLRLANGDNELMTWATSVTGASAEEMRVSCVAFVERVCFSGDTDPFGVLGLNPWANAEAVKEHYRLLIRIFHPDRGQVNNKAAEAYSAKINQAYAVLKHKVGDGGGNLSKPASASYRGQPSVIPRKFTRPVSTENSSRDSLRWASRLTPARVLCGMALLAGLIIYLSFPQKMRMQSKAQGVVERSLPIEQAVSLTPETEEVVADLSVMSNEVANDSHPEAVATQEGKQAVVPEQLPVMVNTVKSENTPATKTPLVKVVPVATVSDKKVVPVIHKPDTKPVDIKPIQIKPIQLKPVETKAVNKIETVPPVTVVQSPVESQQNKKLNVPVNNSLGLADAGEVAVQARIVTPRAASPAAVDVLTDRELHDLIASFMSNYANGDINTFIQLFDEQVRSDEEGGMPGFYNAYADLFAQTASRSIVLKDLQWKKQGALATAHADYRVSALRTGEAQVKTSSGKLQIEVVKTGGRVIISGFFYQHAKR